MMFFSNSPLSATAAVLFTSPVPLSIRLPALVTMPSVSWLSEMLSLVFLKPKVRRMM